MPIRQIAGTDIEYLLVLFDEEGRERTEPDGSQLSAAICQRLADPGVPVTDVFVCSHGWQGDVPAAIVQYDNWIRAMAACEADLTAMQGGHPGFNPLVIGVHWPSLPWGMEAVPAEGAAVLSAGYDSDVNTLAAQLGENTRVTITKIFAYAEAASSTALTPAIEDDFAALFQLSGLRTGGANGRPGTDQDGFDPQAIVSQAEMADAGDGGHVQVLGFGDRVRDAILAPMRQLSFWKMKDRARRFGETGAHGLLIAMQNAAPKARFHLMGHSFGCIVVSGMVAGETVGGALRRPVESLFLVQGALSLWSYAEDVPYAPGTPGYFRRIVAGGMVRGPILTTRSKHDTAVAKFYPLGAGAKGQFLLGDDLPKYGGIGAFGIQGSADMVDMPIAACELPYDFSEGRIFNLEASNVICNGGGPAGAHNDIAHPEVAHAFWAAAIQGSARPTVLAPEWAAAAEPPLAPPIGFGLGTVTPGGTGTGISRGAAPDRGGGGLLGIDEATVVPPVQDQLQQTQAPAPAEEPGPPRWIHADFEGLASDTPVVQGVWYTLAFDLDVVRREGTLVVADEPLPDSGLFAPQAREVVLTVQLDTDDFETSGHTSQMRVPRTGKGFTKARFDVSPLKDGPCKLKATILKDGQFLQQMELTIQVGVPRAPAQVMTRGRALSGVAVLQPRDLSLQVYPGSAGNYECVVCGPVATRVRLPINAGLIDSYINGARAELMKVVMYQDPNGRYVFQRDIDISPEAQAKALEIMARAGALLMLRLFEGAGAGDDARAVARALRQLSTNPDIRLKIQIVAETLPVPWPLLYMGDVSGAQPLDWNNFLGMRHIIEQIPLQNPMAVIAPEIPSAPNLNVSLNFNAGIDAAMGVDFVQSQRSFWKDRVGITVTDRSTPADFISAINNRDTPDQILYLYCHAVSRGLTEAGGPGASSLALTDELISLNDLDLRAPRAVRLGGQPLVFINACESAEMSPTFYDGFAPYFMDKGARGVIGTECKTPALFARVWADRFFERFLHGEPLGEVVLGLRQEFLKQHGNPLGLLYAVHCDADTAIRPALN